MTGRDFLPTARRLAGGRDEGDWRSAVSRAYFAAFHVTRDLLIALRFRPPQADCAHEYVYRRLNNCGLKPVVDAATVLTELRRRRNRADYDMHRANSASDAADAVIDAEFIIQTLDALTSIERTQITDAMKVYEQQIADVTWQP
jgi:uncharacterized protein (UPF0332 family)